MVGTETICPSCGDGFEKVGVHWGKTECDYPELSSYQKELVKGMVMGDGCITHRDANRNPRLKIEMVNKRFLEWFNNQMGILTTDVRKVEYSQKRIDYYNNSMEGRKFENRSDVYRLHSRGSPELQELADWYSSGKKRFPDDLKLTPTSLKIWYVGDGHVQIDDRRCRISCVNEINREDYLKTLFERIGFTVYLTKKGIGIRASESPDFLDYMGNAPPGFEYKWQLDNKKRYKKLKDG